MNQTHNHQPEPESNSRASSLAALVFLVILFLIGFYFYGAKVSEENRKLISLPFQSPAESEDLEDLESELDELEIDSLETTDEDIDSELDSES